MQSCDLSFNAWDCADTGTPRAIVLPATLGMVDMSAVFDGTLPTHGAALRADFVRELGGLVQHARGLQTFILEGNGLRDEHRCQLENSAVAHPSSSCALSTTLQVRV